jgi:hypothetical protein
MYTNKKYRKGELVHEQTIKSFCPLLHFVPDRSVHSDPDWGIRLPPDGTNLGGRSKKYEPHGPGAQQVADGQSAETG